MKKYGLMLSAVALIMLTGCGSKKLTCTQEQNLGTAKMKMKEVVTFDGDYATKAEATITATFDDEETAKTFASYYKDEDNKDQKITVKGKKVTVVETEKVKKEEKESSSNKYKSVKESLESQGFKCK